MRKLFSLILLLSMLSAMVITASAHPGGTDSSGGHRDRSTGEYHYHHGFPAHDHYDMDGDGIMDCPHNFDDKTNHRSTSGSTSRHSTVINAAPLPIATTDDIPLSPASGLFKEALIVPVWFFSPLLLLIVVLLIIIKKQQTATHSLRKENENLKSALAQTESKWQEKNKKQYADQKMAFDKRCEEIESTTVARKNDEISRIRFEHESLLKQKDGRIQALKKDNEFLSAELSNALQSNAQVSHTGNVPKEIHDSYKGIPYGVYLVNGSVVLGEISPQRPFGDFTVYVSPNSKVYHSDPYCGSSFSLKAKHVYDVIDHKRPCLKCGKSHGSTVPEWYHHLTEVSNPAYYQEDFL